MDVVNMALNENDPMRDLSLAFIGEKDSQNYPYH
jgi:hypothetical protein